MGKTIVEKILARACGREEVSVGEYIRVRGDRPVVMGGDGTGKGLPQLRQIGATKLFDPTIVRIVTGHAGAGGPNIKIGETRRRMRVWAREMGIPDENVLDLGRQGVEHIVSAERCWVLPGTVYLSIANGHTSNMGALGAYAVGLSYEAASYLVTGSSWTQVPETAKIVLTGTLGKGVFARDACEYVIGQLGPRGTPGQVMEWSGPVVDHLSQNARFTLCANALFTSARTCIINPDDTTIDYVKARTSEPFEPILSDPDAEYAKAHQFDLSGLEPQVVPPPERTKVFPVSKYEGIRIDRGYIGSCANGRIEDMRAAAQVLKGRKVHRNVQLNITPGSTDVYRQCMREGILDVFVEAEVCIPAPSCGMCSGGSNTPLGDGEICMSTGTCNYAGRMGSDKAQIYLASPATVAASAVAGRIADPRDHF